MMKLGSRVRFSVLALGLTAGVTLALQTPVAGQAKPFVRVTEEQARAAMAIAVESAKGNEVSLRNTFQREVRKIWSDFDPKPVPVYERAEMNISVVGPAQSMVMTAVNLLIMSRPVEKLSWTPGISVSINPMNDGAPDITKVVVTRGGTEVAPLSTNLAIRNFKPVQGFRGGIVAAVHEGAVVFPATAFEPGAPVKVEAIPAKGRALSRTLNDNDLKKIQ